MSLTSPAWAGRLLTNSATWGAHNFYMHWETKKIYVTCFIMVVWNRTHSISKVCLHCFVTGEMFSVNTDLMKQWALPASQTVDEAMGGPGGSGKWEAPFACHLQRNGDHPQLQHQRRRGRLFAHIQRTSSFLS